LKTKSSKFAPIFLSLTSIEWSLALERALATARSKVSTGVSVHHLYELPIPELTASRRQRLGDSAARLLKNPHDVKERAALEVFIARELYGLSLDDWKHLTGTFTFGSGPTKAELDDIIRQSLVLWGT